LKNMALAMIISAKKLFFPIVINYAIL